MIFSGMTSSNTAEYKFYLNSGVIKFQFIIIIINNYITTQNLGLSSSTNMYSVILIKK